MKRQILAIALLTAPLLASEIVATAQQNSNVAAAPAEDADLAADLKLIQGTWELQHGNPNGRPTTRSVKTITGNKETLRRFNAKSGKKTHEHSVEIKLSKSGEVRVCTFYRVGGKPDNGQSFIYRVDKENFYDITGMLQGATYRNYSNSPHVWHWKRVDDEDLPDVN